jgi:hypothetical protein
MCRCCCWCIFAIGVRTADIPLTLVLHNCHWRWCCRYGLRYLAPYVPLLLLVHICHWRWCCRYGLRYLAPYVPLLLLVHIFLRSLLSNIIFTIQPPLDMTLATTVSPFLQAVRASQTTLSIFMGTPTPPSAHPSRPSEHPKPHCPYSWERRPPKTTCSHYRFQQNASPCASPILPSSSTISQPLSPPPTAFLLSNYINVPGGIRDIQHLTFVCLPSSDDFHPFQVVANAVYFAN